MLSHPLKSPIAIVVLGCRLDPGGRPSPPAERRIDRAARAYFDLLGGVPPPLPLAGQSPRYSPRSRERQSARGGGVPPVLAPLGSPACHSGRVVLSGGRLWHGVAEAEGFAVALEACGVPRGALVHELCSLSTLENAAYSSALLRAGGFSDVRLVTCDWHMPRALASFVAMGVSARPLPALSPPATRLGRAARGIGERVRAALDRAAAPHWVEG